MAFFNRQMDLMQQARASSTFNPMKLTVVLYDNEATVSSRRAAFHRVENALGLHDNMKLPHIYSGLDREGLYLEGVRRARVITHDMITHGHNHFQWLNERYQICNSSPFGMNFLMFRRTIELQGTADQRRYWLQEIDQMRINGAYAQTELGHGTFVRGIETTATFDVGTDTFTIHSPTPTSVKYWPGGLGFSCSHAIVAARLITRGKDHGVHMFIVQIRSLEDFAPVCGVELGDLGMKMAYNGTCNGYARFNYLRVPRSSLLAAHAQVSRDGTYGQAQTKVGTLPVSKRVYSTMLDTRRNIVRCVAFGLAQAVTITTRYSIVREQGRLMFSDATDEEAAIIMFKSQHYRLLTLIAQSYAILFAAKDFDVRYDQLVCEQEKDDHARLPFMHALSTGLKAWATTIASAGATEARKMCGGHGFVALSGLPEIEGTVSATVTFEGENYVMWQQLVVYLFKQVKALCSGQDVDIEVKDYMGGVRTYLDEETFPSRIQGCGKEKLFDGSTLLLIYKERSQRLLATAYSSYREMCNRCSAAEAWNTCMMTSLAAGQAFVEYIVIESFLKRISSLDTEDAPISEALSHLFCLFALTTITSPSPSFAAGSFLEHGLLTSDELNKIRVRVNELLAHLLPNIAALTDAWDFTDSSLCSALGCKDGNVYERLLSWTRQLPANSGRAVEKAWEASEGIEEFFKASRL
ncbi:putative acyl-CoA oxidase [Aspergillus nomiae NRRL 13137]|uniref:Acyl-coenzyme A oxidase n=1 Tax=Aspergillus nomiae NRRL (strain ATCC 15546 / NRRL 13137 / CBS 260.88 / M93) TaxID=1509407 RepID=A0A0L1IKZ3_ASPN3|nr:putative acyl-CoA oxidase [Aspergillus nomiae NRRL 13137]KNG80182.1 putative acyl-CoA oxidase [Aspergillus nomiae NRRL 13137]